MIVSAAAAVVALLPSALRTSHKRRATMVGTEDHARRDTWSVGHDFGYIGSASERHFGADRYWHERHACTCIASICRMVASCGPETAMHRLRASVRDPHELGHDSLSTVQN